MHASSKNPWISSMIVHLVWPFLSAPASPSFSHPWSLPRFPISECLSLHFHTSWTCSELFFNISWMARWTSFFKQREVSTPQLSGVVPLHCAIRCAALNTVIGAWLFADVAFLKTFPSRWFLARLSERNCVRICFFCLFALCFASTGKFLPCSFQVFSIPHISSPPDCIHFCLLCFTLFLHHLNSLIFSASHPHYCFSVLFFCSAFCSTLPSIRLRSACHIDFAGL